MVVSDYSKPCIEITRRNSDWGIDCIERTPAPIISMRKETSNKGKDKKRSWLKRTANSDSSAIHPRHPLRNAAENFIRHAFAKPRKFDGIYTLRAGRPNTGPDQDHFIPNRNSRNPSNVDRSQIHGNAPDH